MSLELLSILADYSGVILGAVLLGIGSIFIPGEARKYVLTAGIALILFRSWQIYTNRKRLQEADAKREELRDEVRRLNESLDGLREETQTLRQEKARLRARQRELEAERDALDAATDETLRERTELDDEAAQVDAEAAEAEARLRRLQDQLDAAAALGRTQVQ